MFHEAIFFINKLIQENMLISGKHDKVDYTPSLSPPRKYFKEFLLIINQILINV